MCNKNNKVCTTLNCVEHFVTLLFAVTRCISISDFASLVDIPTRIMSSAIGINISAVVARIKKYKSIIKKKKKKNDEIALLVKIKLDSIKGLSFRSLTDSYIGRNYLLLTDVLRKYDNMKEDIKNTETS